MRLDTEIKKIITGSKSQDLKQIFLGFEVDRGLVEMNRAGETRGRWMYGRHWIDASVLSGMDGTSVFYFDSRIKNFDLGI